MMPLPIFNWIVFSFVVHFHSKPSIPLFSSLTLMLQGAIYCTSPCYARVFALFIDASRDRCHLTIHYMLYVISVGTRRRCVLAVAL